MIRINKAIEPQAWILYRNTDGVSYQAIPALREALLAEQGYICAYCMRRIPTKDENNTETSRIEHVQSRENHPERQLDYTNMVICCPGFMNSTEHCDKSKGRLDISFTPVNTEIEAYLSYSTKDGTIKSSDAQWDKEINEILILNNPLLRYNRNQTLEGIRIVLERKKWRKTELQTKLAEWQEKDSEGKLKPYCGIVLWYLSKKLHAL